MLLHLRISLLTLQLNFGGKLNKQRHPNQSARKQYNPRRVSRQGSSETPSTSDSSDEDETEVVLLDDWDEWIND